MNVNGINSNGTGTQIIRMNMNQNTDSVSKNIQRQIADAQKQMQELSENKELSPEEKMRKRQEIQQQISDLQIQLRQRQIEMRKENQKKSGSSMDDMLGGNKRAVRSEKSEMGMSSESMQALVSADLSMDRVGVQESVKSQLKGKAGVLEAEIKLDSGRGADVEKKKEELADVEAKAQDIMASQMQMLSDVNEGIREAKEEGREDEEKTGGREEKEQVEYEPVGNNVDEKA